MRPWFGTEVAIDFDPRLVITLISIKIFTQVGFSLVLLLLYVTKLPFRSDWVRCIFESSKPSFTKVVVVLASKGHWHLRRFSLLFWMALENGLSPLNITYCHFETSFNFTSTNDSTKPRKQQQIKLFSFQIYLEPLFLSRFTYSKMLWSKCNPIWIRSKGAQGRYFLRSNG